VSIYEVAHIDGHRVSRDDRTIGFTELRTGLSRGKRDSRGHRVKVLSKGEAGEVRVLQGKVDLHCHVLLMLITVPSSPE